MVRMVNSSFSFVKTRCKFEQCKQLQIQNVKKKLGNVLSCRIAGQNFNFVKKHFVTSVVGMNFNSKCC